MKKKHIVSIVIVLILGVLLVSFWNGNRSEGTKRKVYALLPLTGMVADPGNMAKNAMILYMKEHPETDYSLHFIDSESSASKAVAALSNAIAGEDKPIVVSFMLPITLSVLSTVQAKGGFVLATGTLDSPSLQKYQSYVRISHGARDFTIPMANYVNQHYKKIAVIYANDEYGTTVKNVFKENLLSSKVSVLSEVNYVPANADVRNCIERIKNLGCEAVFITGMFSVGYQSLLQEIQTVGLKLDVVTDISFTHPSIKGMSQSIRNSVIFPCFDAELPMPTNYSSRKFRELCFANGTTPYFVTIESFDALDLLDRFLKEHRVLSQWEFAKLGVYEGVSGKIKFDTAGNSFYSPVVARFHNGVTEVLGQKDNN